MVRYTLARQYLTVILLQKKRSRHDLITCLDVLLQIPEPKSTDNRRNGFTTKTIQGSFGETQIQVPRDRDGSFEPVVVPKRQKDVSEIESKVLAIMPKELVKEI